MSRHMRAKEESQGPKPEAVNTESFQDRGGHDNNSGNK